MKLPAAPFLRSHIGNGFGEIPTMTVKILGIVLALAIRMILRLTQNDGAILPRSLAVPLGILNANLNVLRIIGCRRAFSDREAAIPSFHLYAVVGNAKADVKAKSLCQPIGGYAGVWINEHRNHGAWRHRPVKSHLETLSFTACSK